MNKKHKLYNGVSCFYEKAIDLQIIEVYVIEKKTHIKSSILNNF